MDQKSSNPLSKHFRQPSIYIKLPSNGKYWPEGSLDLPVNREMPVYPMTARDEITIRTPDALMNGQSTVNVIQSCCPSVVDAWSMPSIDVDTLLLAIRIASYGNKMNVDSSCPKCGEGESFDVDLGSLLSTIRLPDYETPVEADGLIIKLRPLLYQEVSRVNQISFTEQQIIRTVSSDNLSDDEKKAKYDTLLKKMSELNIDVCKLSTLSITTDNGSIVVDQEFIKEFYENAESSVTKKIQVRLSELATEANLKPLDIECRQCSNKYQSPLTFDYANFFG